MIAIIKWNSRYNAREWVTMAGALVVRLSALNALRQRGKSNPRPPLAGSGPRLAPVLQNVEKPVSQQCRFGVPGSTGVS